MTVPTWAAVDGTGEAADASARADVLRTMEVDAARSYEKRRMDERDEDYDRGRVRKVKRNRTDVFAAAGRNQFQAQAERRQHQPHN